MGTLALGSLLAIAGCNNSLVDNQPIKQAADKLNRPDYIGEWIA